MSRRHGAGAARQPPSAAAEAWSEGETSALLDAWGPRHLRAGGGALPYGGWRACAAAVNSRRCAPRSVAQCQSRIGYLKKRLKVERSKKPPSQWRFFSRLHALLLLSPSSPPPSFSAPHVKEEEVDEEVSTARLLCDWRVPKRRRTSSPECSAAAGPSRGCGGGGGGVEEVAAAVEKLAEVYERVETAKQREAAQLERRRLEVMRDLEIERMRLLIDLVVSATASRCLV